ncbi:hypothetical protein [Taibaiella sp. KBW10]|uniref:hypothetical protein n=1 Tax=Taibaiella sp. KBW10 TaxID=2153357 RepID=UPI0011CD8E2D|nr:hypothetical protein [Taibaiella sp. KBW10]
MTRPYIPFFAFLVLLLSSISLSTDFATSVVPGWHTTVFSPYFLGKSTIIITLLLVTIGYFFLSKRTANISRIIFFIHLILTIPFILFLKFPSIFLGISHANPEKMGEALSLRITLMFLAGVLFIAGQVTFLVYFIRNIIIKRTLI